MGSNTDGIMAMLQDISAKLEAQGREITELKQKQQSDFVSGEASVNNSKRQFNGSVASGFRREDEVKLGDLPEFDGSFDVEAYLDWERRIERVFNHKELDDDAHRLHSKLQGRENDMEEGPFKVVHREGYDTFQVLLGQGICASFQQSDLVSCFDNT